MTREQRLIRDLEARLRFAKKTKDTRHVATYVGMPADLVTALNAVATLGWAMFAQVDEKGNVAFYAQRTEAA